MRHKAISGLSIGYYALDFTEEAWGGRKLKEIELVEISVVESPADLGAQIEMVKSTLGECASLKQIEAVMRDNGITRQMSTAIVSAVKNVIKHGDHADEKSALKELQSFKLNL